uniref:Glycosyl hydrolase n=1 Tax=Heterorhabditis bacteriophora TaxID=37862 RepID=A0A1I7W780_HETBA
MRCLLLGILLFSYKVYGALDTAAVIAIQNELNKHSVELEMLLDVRNGDGLPGLPG